MNWRAIQTSSHDDILAWADDQPWARAMARCAQDEGWHAEGDVWTHTKMVCDQLPLLDEWAALTAHDRTVLFLTALFHDAGKPLTSQVDPATGRVTSPKHAVKGEHLSRSILRGLGCDLATREEVCRMVRFHGRPAFLLERPEPSHEVASLSWLVSNRLLYLFALADTRGRTTAETGRPEDNLHLFRLAAEEHGCFDAPYPFANDHARFLFHRHERPSLYYAPHEDYRCTVTILSGLPAAGKDSWLAAHRPGLPVVSLDDLRGELEVRATDDQGGVVQAGRERCRAHLRAGRSFAFNATNLLRQTRRRWIDLFADYGALIEVVYVEPPLPEILARNARRSSPVPERVILRLAEKSEPPTFAEAHELVVTDGAASETRRRRRVEDDPSPTRAAAPRGAVAGRYPEPLHYHDRDIEEELDLIALTRRQMARILRLLPEGTWGRTAIHSETGLVTLRQLVLHAVRHQEHHLWFVAEKRRTLGVPEAKGLDR